MATEIDTDVRNVALDAIADEFDGGTLKIYTGAQPASPNDAPSGTLLATIDLPTPAFGAAAAGSVAKNGTWQDTSADATGTAGWARLESSDGVHRIDMDAGEGSGTLNLDETAIVATGTVTVSACTISLAES